ncbi:MAG: type IV pilus twitching motility protein PilT [Planctomycetes bacterium]|nr:type IV pilus twitching motility protein PilT [Planctomycetota bacterium]
MSMHELLKAAVRHGASDLHLSTGLPPMVRVHGDVVPLPGWTDGPMPAEMTTALIESILDARQRGELEKRSEYDFSVGVPEIGRFRGNAYQQHRGPGVALRLIPEVVRSLEDLGAPPALGELMLGRQGLVLITGATGSGKSTTAAALIDLINRSRPGHIVSVEDPIEFVHTPQKCLVTQREVGHDTGTFPDALRAALREDPDVIFIGEMRDLATIALAVTAAETGHLVIATLHTAGAARSVDRIVNVFPAAEQQFIRTLVAGCLIGVTSQALLRRKDQPGRIAAFEMLVSNAAVRNMIRQGKIHQLPSVIQTGQNDGMCTFRRSVLPLVADGRVDAAEANRMLSLFEDDEGGDVTAPTPDALAAAHAAAS